MELVELTRVREELNALVMDKANEQACRNRQSFYEFRNKSEKLLAHCEIKGLALISHR